MNYTLNGPSMQEIALQSSAFSHTCVRVVVVNFLGGKTFHPILPLTQNKLNDCKRTEKYIICTTMMYWKTFYGRHMAHHQLQWR